MIERQDRDGIRVLRLAHGKVSAMDIELGEAFTAELKSAAEDAVRGVVVTGTGSSFSAGVDLFRLIKDGPDYGQRFLPVLDTMLRDTLTFPKPLVAAVNGHAIAGGCILTTACDHRIMAEGTVSGVAVADCRRAHDRRDVPRPRAHRPDRASGRSGHDWADR